ALAERVPFSRGGLARAFAVHVPAAILVSVGKLVAEGLLTLAILGPMRGPFTLLKVHITVLTYCGIVVATHVARRYESARARELQATQLEAALAGAQVEALKMQLHPHFLFNTLNAISGLMRDDVEAADLMLANLSDLLRRTFECADVHEVPLRRE